MTDLSPLEKARLARQQNGAAPAPVISNPMVRFRNKPTRGSAIKAMCAHCMGCTYESIEPGFRALVRDCTSTDCPLHSFRPYQRADATDAEDGEEAEAPNAQALLESLF